MRLIAAICLLWSTMLASAREPLVSMSYGHSMRIPHSRIQIVIDAKGLLTVETESRGKNKNSNKIQVSQEKVMQLKRQLESLDWQKISADKTMGLDGTSVRITSGKHTASLWSPDYNSKKRGLADFQKLVETIFDFAGLDRSGMPK